MVMYGPPVGSIASTKASSPSYRTLMRHELVRLEKLLIEARVCTSTCHKLLSMDDVLSLREDELEVEHLEGLVAIQRCRFQNLLSAEARHDEVLLRLSDLESLYAELDAPKSICWKCTHYYRECKCTCRDPHGRKERIEKLIAHERWVLQSIMSEEDRDTWQAKIHSQLAPLEDKMAFHERKYAQEVVWLQNRFLNSVSRLNADIEEKRSRLF